MLEEIGSFGKFPYRENNFPVCGHCAVVCEYFEFFQSSPVCGLCAVVCGDFEFFQSSPVCGPCVVVCEDFEFSEFP